MIAYIKNFLTDLVITARMIAEKVAEARKPRK